MSSAQALKEIERFLSEDRAEVIGITGRWGVGKTTAWQNEINRRRGSAICNRKLYAYVSAFGLRSLDALKSLIFQSAEPLTDDSFRPNWNAFSDSLSDEEGRQAFIIRASRWLARPVKTAIAGLPIVGKLSDLIDFSSSHLVANQIVCIDDVERAGAGLDIQEILGFASFLKEQRNCKVLLLLNEDGLKESRPTYREYLEKVIDHSVRFEPTPSEAAALALGKNDLDIALANRTVQLGITNIRVIRRLRRFLFYLEDSLNSFHPNVLAQAVSSVALLGWAVFEPDLAPKLNGLRGYPKSTLPELQKSVSTELPSPGSVISNYGFAYFDDFDKAILLGLEAGWFDEATILAQARIIDTRARVVGLQEAIHAPWRLMYGSFDDNTEIVAQVLYSSGIDLLEHMSPQEISDRAKVLRELDRVAESDSLITLYIKSIDGNSREFYEQIFSSSSDINVAIKDVIQKHLNKLPLAKDPKEVLLSIGDGWSQEAIKYLTTISVKQIVDMLMKATRDETNLVVGNAIRLERNSHIDSNCGVVASNMRQALKALADTSRLNALRVRRLLGYDP